MRGGSEKVKMRWVLLLKYQHGYQGTGWKDFGRQGGMVGVIEPGNVEQYRDSTGVSINRLGGLVTTFSDSFDGNNI